jgi:streptomycin 6-kinase
MTDRALKLPKEYKQRVVAVWGEDGREWLQTLPSLIAHYQQSWSLHAIKPLPNLSYNFVAQAVVDSGTQAILKIGVPNPELFTEIEILSLYKDKPVAKLLEADHDHGAFLIEQVVPGIPLHQWEDDEEQTKIIAHTIKKLLLPIPPEHQFPTIDKWFLAFERLRKNFDGTSGPLPERLVRKAESLFTELQASAPGEALLHGDLHHDNILSNGNHNWLVIDPKGVVADPAYEAARLQHNPIPHFLAMPNPERLAQKRISILSDILEIERNRLLAWGFFDALLSACWSVEDNEDWSSAIACAEILDGLTD